MCYFHAAVLLEKDLCFLTSAAFASCFISHLPSQYTHSDTVTAHCAFKKMLPHRRLNPFSQAVGQFSDFINCIQLSTIKQELHCYLFENRCDNGQSTLGVKIDEKRGSTRLLSRCSLCRKL